MMKLWELNFSSAWGWRWEYQRDVTPETSEQWLQVFQKDQPLTQFKLSKNRPRSKKIMVCQINYNPAHVKRIPIDADNVRWVNNLILAKGRLTTLDGRPYVDLLCQYGVFYTLKERV